MGGRRQLPRVPRSTRDPCFKETYLFRFPWPNLALMFLALLRKKLLCLTIDLLPSGMADTIATIVSGSGEHSSSTKFPSTENTSQYNSKMVHLQWEQPPYLPEGCYHWSKQKRTRRSHYKHT